MLKYLFLIATIFLSRNSFVFAQTVNHKLANGWYYLLDEDQGTLLKLEKSNSFYFLDSIPIVTSKNIQNITFSNNDDGNPFLIIQFDSVGTAAWKFATMKSINKRLGFIFNNKLIQAPKVNSEIDFGVSVIWDYDRDALSLIKSVLETEFNILQ